MRDDAGSNYPTDNCKYKKRSKPAPCPPPPTPPCPCVKDKKVVCGCPGNDCCGVASCLVASCDSCDAPCANDSQNLVITSKRNILLPILLGSPIPSTGIQGGPQDFYVQLPTGECTGPVSLVWSVANTILNTFQSSHLASILTPGAFAKIDIRLNILTQKAVFDVAKLPAAQSNGFASFGTCNCNDSSVIYTIKITYGLTASPDGSVFFGYYTVYDPANNLILLPGIGGPTENTAIGFKITNGNSLVQFIVRDVPVPDDFTIAFDDPRKQDIVTPAVIASFTQSSACDPSNRFFSLVDLSRLQA